MDLYYGRWSGNSARALFGLFESGLPFTPRLVDTANGANRAPEYLAVNPMGKIPALADGAFHLWESNAINWYAAERSPASGLLPASAEGRASVQRWLFFQAAHVSPSAVPILRATHAPWREFWKATADAAAAEAARMELHRWLAVLEGALAGRDWLEGGFTLADVAYAPHLGMLLEGGLDLAGFPAVAAWLRRMLARPAWARTRALVFA